MLSTHWFRTSWLLLLLSCAVGTSLAAASAGCQGDSAFYFKLQPKSITVREGGRAFLECNVNNRCNIQFQWTLNRKIVMNTTRRYQNGSNLIITRVNRSLDEGDFHCVATFTETAISKESHLASLWILWIRDNTTVRLESPGSVAEAQRGGAAVRLRCDADGSDELSFFWYRNGRRLRRDDGRVEPKQQRLTVVAAHVADNGVYSCAAENSAGIVRSRANFVLAVAGDGVPKIVHSPSDVIGREESSVNFDCKYENAQRTAWRKVGEKGKEEYSDSGRIRQQANGSLLLTELTKTDAGDYECLGYGESSNAPQAYSARLVVAELGEFRSTSFEPVRHLHVVGVGKRFKVECVPPGGYPRPRAFWMRHAALLPPTGRVRAEGLRLVVDSAAADDAGAYVCVAENVAGRREGRLELFLSRPPTITFHPSTVNVIEGVSAFFECRFNGNEYPVTSVSWEKDGEAVRPERGRLQAGELDRLRYHRNNGSLIIDRLRPSDAGDYQCVVSTADQPTVRSKSARLTVREKLKFNPAPVDRKFEYGTNGRIHCSTSGDKPPKVHWYQMGRLTLNGSVSESFAKPVDTFPANIRTRNGTIYFRRIRFEDAGLYMCVAVNGQGVIKKIIKVEIFIAPQYLRAPTNQTVVEGRAVWFHCEANGTPTPYLEWYFDGKAAVDDWPFENAIVNKKNNSLEIRDVTVANAGSFSCLAGNKGGFKRRNAVLCVKLVKSNLTTCGREGGFMNTEVRDGLSGGESDAVGRGGVSTRTVLLAGGASVGYLLLGAALFVFCSYRSRRERRRRRKSPAAAIVRNGAADPASASRGPLVSGAAGSEALSNGHTLSSGGGGGGDRATPLLPRPRPSPRALTVSPVSSATTGGVRREQLDWQMADEIGSGVYGDVFVSWATGVWPGESRSLVLVKALQEKDENIRLQLREEMDLFIKADHPHVAKLVAFCNDAEPILVVYDYCDLGSLKNFMQLSRKYSGDGCDFPMPLNAAQIISIAYQVAQGMEHISDHRFVHKDLAARNVLLSSNFSVKISSLSLQNDGFMQEYYMYRNLAKPLRWMPSEALLDDDWSMKSDVWSFGVFVWELYTCGELPYNRLSNDDVIAHLKDGSLQLTDAAAAAVGVRQLIARCCSDDRRQRPTFTDIRDALGQLHVETGL